jgi:hypothetical protein
MELLGRNRAICRQPEMIVITNRSGDVLASRAEGARIVRRELTEG